MEKGAMADEPRRLSDFLRAHRERILSDWVDAVRVLEPAKDLDQPVLLDSLPQFLDELADFLDDVRAGHPAKEPVNPPTIHALDRLEVGYDLTEVVEEYAILRRCIVELVHDEGAPAMRSAQLARLHTGIDRAIVTSTARYHQASERTLRALERISSTALTYGEADVMLPELLKVLLETCASVDAASLLLLEGEVLRVHAAVGLGLEKTVGEIVPVGHSLAGRVAQTRGPIASREAASDPMVTRESIRRAGLRGYYGVPMMLGEELVGVATIGSRHANEFSEEDRLLFRTMSGRAAALIAKARLNAELTRRNAELSAALDYRDRMLGILSHDLKNPLGVILASSYVLEKAGLDDAQKRSLARVTSAAGRIDRMIKDLLDYTRARMDRALPIARREVDLLEVCKQAVDELRLLNPRRVIRLDCEGSMTVSLDPDRVARAVGNLVNNALRYGDPDAPIDVSLRRASAGIVLEVHNQGTPIQPDLLPHLFEAFQRGPDAGGEGLGLGLYIVKQIVDAHGGSITVRSTQAEGTTFSVLWPAS
ncbi:MAG: GAF domain-containing protein [Deltaproteobacteria bacterium]|nr:MAG: GAF domain-containing protein [Deltaproteobacteria bacterium]